MDALKMFGSENSPQVYTVASDQQRLSIYNRSYPTENISIPLGFELGNGTSAEFVFEGIANFDPEMQLLLEDLYEDRLIDLRAENTYSFTHEPGSDPLRFVLHMQVKSVTGTDPLPDDTPFSIFSAGGQVHVQVPSMTGQPATVEVFDLLGRRQQHHQVDLYATTILDAGAFKGVAIVRVVAGQQVFTERVIIQ